MIIIIGNGRKVSLSEVLAVAESQASITLDFTNFNEPKSSGDGVVADKSVLESSIDTSNFFPVNAIRAGIFCRLISILQAKTTVRRAVLECLVRLLNMRITPMLSAADTAGLELAAVLQGNGFCANPEGTIKPTSEVLFSNTSVVVALNGREVDVLSKIPFLSVGFSCMLAGGMQCLMKSIDLIGAYSCEAFCAKSSPFDAVHFEVNRQHRGQMQSSMNLRLYLEGSKRINSNGSLDAAAARAFHDIPQVHGPCFEAIIAAAK